MIYPRDSRTDSRAERHFRRAGGKEDDFYYSIQEKDDYDEYEEDEFV
jgi:hypothetical protein